MLLAAISLIPPAAARIFGSGQPLTVATLLLLIVALFAYDTWRLGRPQAVTWLGGLGLVAWSTMMLGGVAQSSFGRAVTLALS